MRTCYKDGCTQKKASNPKLFVDVNGEARTACKSCFLEAHKGFFSGEPGSAVVASFSAPTPALIQPPCQAPAATIPVIAPALVAAPVPAVAEALMAAPVPAVVVEAPTLSDLSDQTPAAMRRLPSTEVLQAQIKRVRHAAAVPEFENFLDILIDHEDGGDVFGGITPNVQSFIDDSNAMLNAMDDHGASGRELNLQFLNAMRG